VRPNSERSGSRTQQEPDGVSSGSDCHRSDGSAGCCNRAKFDGFRSAITIPTEADAKRSFDALADGGSMQMPPTRTFWLPCYGMLTDRFGLGWKVMVPAIVPTPK
jgi:uncharacterized glyoxalase superfamily protein PhnB